MVAIGLHLTKCAGTSLMTSMRRLLAEDEYVLISSFYENILASRAQPWDVVDLSRLVFVFGHYVNEGLVTLLRPKTIWDFFLFTGVREPSARAVSQYYQLAKITSDNPPVDQFVSEYGNSMCDEIIRAFPSLINSDKPKWLLAAEALTSFDYIYSTERYALTIGPVYESAGLLPPSIDDLGTRDNIRVAPLELGIVSEIQEAMTSSDDAKLYTLIEPAIGKQNAGKLIAEAINTERQREKIFGKACSKSDHDSTPYDFGSLYDMMGYELYLLGDKKKAEVIEVLEKRSERDAAIIHYLKTRIY